MWSQWHGLGLHPDVGTVDMIIFIFFFKRKLFLVRVGGCGNAELALSGICQLWSAMVKLIGRPVGEPVGLDVFI